MRDDEHGDRLTIVGRRANDHVAQNAAGVGGADARLRQVIAKREGDPVRANAVDRAFPDRNDPIRAARVMTHDESLTARVGAERERDLLPERRNRR